MMNENIMNQEVVNEEVVNEVMEVVNDVMEDVRADYLLSAEEEPEVSGSAKLAAGVALLTAGAVVGYAGIKGVKKAKKFIDGKLDCWAEKRLAKKESLDDDVDDETDDTDENVESTEK